MPHEMSNVVVLALATMISGPVPLTVAPDVEWSTARPDSATVRARMIAVLDSARAAGGFTAATAAVVLDGGVLVEVATGDVDRAGTRSARPHDRMFAGSVGKTFFAALALDLVREGRLDLDRPLVDWFGGEPWFDSLPNVGRDEAEPVTARHLMTHTSGLVRYVFHPRFLEDLRADPMREWDPREQLSYLAGVEPPFAPGEGFTYSDTNYILLAILLERITGGDAYDEIRRRFLEPLELDGTVPSAVQVPGLVQGYAGPQNPFGDVDAVVGEDGTFFFDPRFEWGGGGFVSTAPDLARWARYLWSGGVVEGALFEELIDGVPAPELGPGVRYGLGVILAETPRGTIRSHSGFFPGYLTDVRYYPDSDVALALQINTSDVGALGTPLPRIMDGLAAAAGVGEGGGADREQALDGACPPVGAGVAAGLRQCDSIGKTNPGHGEAAAWTTTKGVTAR